MPGYETGGPICGRPIIQGNRGFGCSGWRDGCSFVIWPTWQEQELSLDQIRRLLQRHVLRPPLPSKNGGNVILALTDSGQVTEIPVPQSDSRSSDTTKKSRRSPPGNKKRRATSQGNVTKKGSTNLGECPRCQAPVVEQTRSFSCSEWRTGCACHSPLDVLAGGCCPRRLRNKSFHWPASRQYLFRGEPSQPLRKR